MPTVLITGAGRGLGLEFARQYAGQGWKVIGTVRDDRGRGKLAGIAPGVQACAADVADRSTLARLAADLAGVPIDVLICNAGVRVQAGTAFGTIDYEAWERLLRVNLMGPLAVAEALAANVAASRRKVIAMISSRLGSIAEASHTEYLYGSSKSALNAVAKALANDLAGQGITVVALSPGWVRTDMGGAGAPLAPETSVRGMRQVIDGLTPARSGKFLHYDGTEVPW